ncbi:hypothetical protein GS462_24395 [Rhodococcus hoagii]|nr:hypothetical protein [Prescottella equi]
MNIDDSFLQQIRASEMSRAQQRAMEREYSENMRQVHQVRADAAVKRQDERDHDVAIMEEQTRLARESAELARESRSTAKWSLWVAVASLAVAVIAVIVAVVAIAMT